MPVAKVVPFPSEVKLRSRGSLAGKLVLAEDWDSLAVNTEIAHDFGVARVQPARANSSAARHPSSSAVNPSGSGASRSVSVV